MKDMKCEHKGMEMVQPQPESKYPYGLRLHLDNESLKKLTMQGELEVGAVFKLTAEVVVVGTSEQENILGENYSADLQITKMELAQSKTKKKTAAESLYGEDSEDEED